LIPATRNPDNLSEHIGNECICWRNGHPCGCVVCRRAQAVFDLMACARTLLDFINTPGIDFIVCRLAVERVEKWKE
jgi:hypothetical protein